MCLFWLHCACAIRLISGLRTGEIPGIKTVTMVYFIGLSLPQFVFCFCHIHVYSPVGGIEPKMCYMYIYADANEP